MRVGFTGTRSGMTERQGATFRSVAASLSHFDEFHHGSCVGADQDADAIISQEFPQVAIHAWPGLDSKGQSPLAFTPHGASVHKSWPYLTRNRLIVDASHALIACPAGFVEELRSGTWFTIRYATRKGRNVFIIYPDGTLECRGTGGW